MFRITHTHTQYGRIRDISIKAVRPPIFAFIEYYDPRDADDAVYYLDGRRYFGAMIRVEPSRGSRDARPGPARPVGGGQEMGPPRRGMKSTGLRLRVEGLPASASWQDLKDHVREVLGFSPPFANVYNDAGKITGIIEFDKQSDLDTAYDKLHKSEFKNRYDSSVIAIEMDEERDAAAPSGRGRSRSRSKSRSRSRSRSASRGRSRSRSPRRD